MLDLKENVLPLAKMNREELVEEQFLLALGSFGFVVLFGFLLFFQ